MAKWRRDSLGREITVTLIVKFILIFVIWFSFFRQSDHGELSDKAVERALLGPRTVLDLRNGEGVPQ